MANSTQKQQTSPRDESCLCMGDKTVDKLGFYNSAITELVVRARIVVEMGSHLVPVQSHNSFLDQRSRILSHCVISQEPFLYSVRSLCETVKWNMRS